MWGFDHSRLNISDTVRCYIHIKSVSRYWQELHSSTVKRHCPDTTPTIRQTQTRQLAMQRQQQQSQWGASFQKACRVKNKHPPHHQMYTFNVQTYWTFYIQKPAHFMFSLKWDQLQLSICYITGFCLQKGFSGFRVVPQLMKCEIFSCLCPLRPRRIERITSSLDRENNKTTEFLPASSDEGLECYLKWGRKKKDESPSAFLLHINTHKVTSKWHHTIKVGREKHSNHRVFSNL